MSAKQSESDLSRISISLPGELLDGLDAMVKQRGLPSRSHAIGEMIQQQIAEHSQRLGHRIVAGTITVVYRSSRGRIRNELAAIQRKYLKETISSQHVFLERDHSLEVLLVQGPGKRLQLISDAIAAVKGVVQVRLSVTAQRLPPLY